MKIILMQDIKNIGKRGDIKNVSDGYARNFLLPKKLAEIATPEALKKAELQKAQEQEQEKTGLEQMKKTAEKLKGLKLTLKAQQKDEKLFGSITAKDIVSELKNRHLEIDEKSIILKEPIKKTGSYQITIDFGHQIKSQIEISVEGKK
ncbi:MAG: 50S ribosomal protein L9 [Candidatus Moranbacteria bacterium]|nr:50S ribosomal protein L9 [Candidatus Moranbacteria bacterium]